MVFCPCRACCNISQLKKPHHQILEPERLKILKVHKTNKFQMALLFFLPGHIFVISFKSQIRKEPFMDDDATFYIAI